MRSPIFDESIFQWFGDPWWGLRAVLYCSQSKLPPLLTIDHQIFEKLTRQNGIPHQKTTNISKSMTPMATKLGESLDHMYTKQGWGLAIILMAIKINEKNGVRPKCWEKTKKIRTLTQTHNKWRKKSNSIPGTREKTKKSYFRTKFVKTMIFNSKRCS